MFLWIYWRWVEPSLFSLWVWVLNICDEDYETLVETLEEEKEEGWLGDTVIQRRGQATSKKTSNRAIQMQFSTEGFQSRLAKQTIISR